MKSIHTLTLAVAGFALALNAAAQSTMLAPQAERISDAVIQQDYASFERIQARIKALNDGGRRVADYHLAKAQCWLDTSFHEYTRNDRSAFPQAAMSESEKLVALMEQRAEPLPSETPPVNDAAKLRPDLWERFHALKQGPGFICSAQKTACAEVELVHAGNEFNQQGWRHAKPYVQIAEDQLAEAEASARACLPAPVPAPAPRVAEAPAPMKPMPAPADKRMTFSAGVVFGFDRSDRAGIRPAGLAQLDALLARLAGEGLRVVGARLVGHADRLNGTGSRDYNQRLSEKRAATVRGLLVERGVAAGVIEVSAEGDATQVDRCEGGKRSTAELEECLLPNRRVDVLLTTGRQP